MTIKVLLIEDDTTMLTLLQTLLEFEGYIASQMEGEDNLDAIVEAIRKEKPSLILLDVHLTQVNGFELYHQIKNDDELHDIRVIITSGMDFCERCQEEGVDGFLQKPFMPEELIQKIRELSGD